MDAEVPGLSSIGIHLSIESLLEADGQDGLVKVLDLIQFLNSSSWARWNGLIAPNPIAGSLTFNGADLKDILDGNPSALTSAPDDPSGLLNRLQNDPTFGSYFKSLNLSPAPLGSSPPAGFDFPILTDPADCAFQLIEGKNPTLFTSSRLPPSTRRQMPRSRRALGRFRFSCPAASTSTSA